MKFGRSPAEIEHSRKVFLVALFAIAGSVFLIPLGLWSLVEGRFLLGLVLLGNSAFCISLMIYSRITGRVTGVSYIFAVQAGVLALFLVLHGGIAGSGVYFSFALTLMMVMAGFQSMRSGILVCLVFLAVVAAGLYGPFPWVYDYDPVHRSRILMGFSAQFIMALIAEFIRTLSYSAITDTTERLSVDAFHDSLTGLLNRRGLENRVGHMESEDLPAVLAVIDLDHFKQTNDIHGHDAGDVALCFMADRLRGDMKGRDIMCRWGGEEFLVIFTQTTLEDARRVLEQIRREVASARIGYGGTTFSLTFSAGMMGLCAADRFAESLQQADQFLYQAKQGGRNRIVSPAVSLR
jgi:diguanylate cyclase (GGDEF)-like protein